MSGMLGFITKREENIDYLIETIDPLKVGANKIIEIDQGCLVVSYPKNSPLEGDNFFNDEKWVLIFNGDLIDYKSVPLSEIIENIENRNFEYFKRFDGIFSIAAYNKKESKLFLVTDRLSLYPLYYFIDKNSNLYFSSNMSTFCRLNEKLEFDENWLYEYLFFNYPIGETTFLKGIKRMSAASVLEIDVKGNYSLDEYAKKFKRSPNLLKGDEALNLGLKLFSERIPKYYEGSCEKICSLTGGWDARTVLSLAPEMKNILTYTYGINGSFDLEYAAETAKLLGTNHKKIIFDKNFSNELSNYILETVFISGGLQNILRSSLLYVYKDLFKKTHFPVFLNGIYFDTIFRGHMNVPNMISYHFLSLIRGNAVDLKLFREIFKDECYDSFSERITKKIDEISIYGEFSKEEFHLSYVLYETLKSYFGGEISIAKEFGTIRIPAIDTKILNFAYSNSFSTLTFSEFGEHKRGGDNENILQALIISKNNSKLSKICVNGTIIPESILKGKLYFIVNCAFRKGLLTIKNKIKPKEHPPLENWDYWLNELNREFVDDLIFSKDSKLKKFIKKGYLKNLRIDRNVQIIGKLVTAEIILRLIDNNWEKFW